MSRVPPDRKPAIARWVAEHRNLVGMSAEDLAEDAGYSVSAIRKVEGGSNPNPSPAIIGAVFRVLRKVGAARGVVVPDPPGYGDAQPAADLSALVAAIDRQTEAISALLARFDSLASEAIRRGVDAAVAEAAERRAGGGLRPEPHSQQFG